MVNVQTNSIRAWILAARPKTLSGAIVPVIIGASLAYLHDSFQLIPTLICITFAGLMQIAANFINDLYDYLKGTDRKEDRLGPDRACTQGWITPNAMKKGIAVVIIIACAIGSTLIYYGGWTLILIGILCVIFAFAYTTGPYPLSYHGYGDILVLLFFGFVPVGGTYYVQALDWNMDVTMASIVCGLIIDTLLVVNNYRDYIADFRSGKKTLIVRFGKDFGAYLYLGLGLVASVISLTFVYKGYIFAGILPQFYLIPHIKTYAEMKKIYEGKKLNLILGKTSQNILLMGFLLSLGFILSR
ncbi:1,4-dihydroxy-2-naphthoate polyprenyltransferase [Bacteroides coprosuis]|uniref:1,4-dihydroxy-2-naphthoate polyprenyltransferase n=1 Tax=Bacteroides coprosuis TaxID=151276 RepID=UPI001D63F026|nr:1,4-dihydroxy-2-naphthoate polyprenyltransferase [Bacteroides coprosuis]HJD93298.1 1,4-dihydroxy-2-naphthoate polyprenyltransferase [Bacteroides coprosuis]